MLVSVHAFHSMWLLTFDFIIGKSIESFKIKCMEYKKVGISAPRVAFERAAYSAQKRHISIGVWR